MGTSFVGIDEKGFWMRDGLLCMWLRLVAVQIRCGANGDDPLTRLRNEWMYQSQIELNGLVSVDLETIAGNDVAEDELCDAIRRVMTCMRALGAEISVETQNLLGVHGWSVPVKTSRFIEIGEAFLDLIHGRITSTAHNTDFMPGCRP
ncbi:hypothetical protein [Oricola sp.]|uniref:hypothetical protein n=1 Tax=Oricola sp. TaxID=1979950 RepID=UPI0025CF3878|nr:hypothetical protein [Oricola sp.]MCI5078345.1 hypothetical protein [Oricola sp.]